MKRILYLIVDLFIIYGSVIFTFYFLAYIDLLEDFNKNFHAFEVVAPFVGISYLILMYAFGLYNINRMSFFEIVYSVFLISLSLWIGIMGFCFLIREVALAFPRSVIFLSALFYFIFLAVWRLLLWFVSRKLRSVKKIIIIGDSCNKLVDAITCKYSHFYQIEYQCTEDDPLLSSKIESVDEVFLCSGITQKRREYILPVCIKYKKNVCFVPKYFDLSIMASSFYKTDDIPTFQISSMELSPEERFVKRSIDLLFGLIASIIALPIALILAFLIKLDGGPVLYVQERFTEGYRRFNIFKFRTMIPDAEKHSGPVLAGEKDTRITKVGRFIRFVRLDEIPQLINILKGDMSIVGPRPERPFFVEQFEKEIPEYSYRFKVKAGLTGLAQVEGRYNTSVENKLRYDLIYINKYSGFNDLLIMLQTLKILFMKESTEGIKVNKQLNNDA
jgi:exopolysaccharide biosynthesis polyprenyl glycosylphosphotransferase